MSSQCIAIAVVEHAGQFLVGLRPAGVPLAGYWEFPGGKVRAGETPQQAAARECLEETGVHVTIGMSYPSVTHEYEHGTLEIHFFAAQPCHSAQSPRPPFRWVRREELSALKFPPANAQLLKLLNT
jgi:8-oxo-dGTP diphosphatase